MQQIEEETFRVIVIDDVESIHDDFRKSLSSPKPEKALADAEAMIFGDTLPAQRPDVVFDVDSALQGQEGFTKILQAVDAGRPYALAFVDMRMPPGWDGLETIEHLWQADPNLQVVICSAYSDHSWSHIVDRLGMSDRLLILKKPFDNVEVTQLAAALTHKWMRTRQAALKLEELEKLAEQRSTELHHAAMHDSLTGLPNRAQLRGRLTAALNGEKRDACGLLFLDADRFKIINDSLGHGVGDLLLKEISARIVSALDKLHSPLTGADAMVARLGGDEFVVLAEGVANLGPIRCFGEAIREVLNQPYRLGGHEVHTTVSIGVTHSRLSGQSPDVMLRDADAAMYAAKSAGKDRLAVFDQSMHEQTLHRLELENDLRKAIADGQFHLVYQPIVDAETSRTLGFEALARWEHPTRGRVSPAEFIPIAEETGLIIPLGEQFLRTAVDQLKQWQQLPDQSNLYMSVNLSKRQLLDPNFLSQIKRILLETEVSAQTLKLEVTESIIMDQAERVTPLLDRLKKLGVGLSMDDFGTGHSSLNCLHSFPIDVLKIDQAFIRNQSVNIEYAAVVQAVVTLAGNLGMEVIAEGIETPEQLAMIQALECSAGQGYFFARPMAAEVATEFLHQPRPEVNESAGPAVSARATAGQAATFRHLAS